MPEQQIQPAAVQPSKATTVLLIGHCGPDGWMLKSFVQNALPGADVAMVHDQKALEAQANKDTLLVVNRVLETGFDTDNGIELIAQLAGRPQPPTMMLVSNYPEAQAAAVKAGARLGFGKAELGRTRTTQLLRAAAGR